MPHHNISERIQTADWKSEKHVPVIECGDSLTKGEMNEVAVTIGKEVSHPNTTEHHIRWIELYFAPEKGQPYQVARCEFNAHGESAQGPNEGPVYTHHGFTCWLKTDQPGSLHAMSYCNIHGLWQNSKEVSLA